MHDSAGSASPEHVAAFFKTGEFLRNRVASFVAEGIATEEQVIVLATHQHWSEIRATLAQNGIALARAEGERRLLWLDADEALSALTVDGIVSVDAFRATLQRFVDPTIRQRIYGELVSLLAARGDLDTAIAIEALGHDFSRTLNTAVLCGYAVDAGTRLTPEDVVRIEGVHDRCLIEGKTVAADGAINNVAAEAARLHAVRFYENRDSLAKIVGKFLGEGFVLGLPAIVIATPEHRDAIKNVLASHYFDVQRLAGGELILLDARETLSQFLRNGMPDATLFRDAMIPVIERACRGREHCVIRAYGEMVDVLWKDGETAAAIRLEMLWNQLAQTHSFSLLCGYSMGHFYKDVGGQQDVRRQHTHLVSDSGEHLTLH